MSNTAEPQSALDRLAERMGIAAEFRSATGATVRATDETKRRLLAAMGVMAGDDAAARDALAALDRADWERPLPPVAVLQAEGGPAAVALALQPDAGEVTWRLALESGGERQGRVAFASLERLAARELDGRPLERRKLVLGDGLPWGYHRLAVEPGGAAMTVIVTPGRCWLPDRRPQGERLWGIATQLYLLRSAQDWGIGDFGDLRRFVGLAAEAGAAVIGLNPLHAMFHDAPEQASPYSPASRLLLNLLYIDIAALPEIAHCAAAQRMIAEPGFQARLQAARAAALVDYAAVTALKLPVLEALYAACRDAADRGRWQDFEAFRAAQGGMLQRNCLFLALREHFAAADPHQADWHAWPEAYRDPQSDAVHRFAAEQADRVSFLAWLQWVADSQLGAAARAASERGMPVGLYRDLAVGADRAGAETWANSAAVISGAEVGAPPDVFNTAGQGWGLPPFSPRALRQEAYRSFVELLRANMRHAGGLRIDHVMGLQRLYWVPLGSTPRDGAYVRYPVEEMVGILALESQRQRCLVVGEDLGTVPEGFRERMAAANVLSYRVLFFERTEDGAFLPPEAYPPLAVAVTGSHDLPTLRGWWEARDIDIKQRLGMLADDAAVAQARAARAEERAQLLDALRQAGLIEGEEPPDLALLSQAAHRFLGRSPSMLAMAQLDDLTEELEPVNVPATSTEHPNWRRKFARPVEELAAHPAWARIAAIFQDERGGGAHG